MPATLERPTRNLPALPAARCEDCGRTISARDLVEGAGRCLRCREEVLLTIDQMRPRCDMAARRATNSAN